MISWPAVICYKGEDELTLVTDQSVWENDLDFHTYPYVEGDILIDTKGNVFHLRYHNKKKTVEIFTTNELITLDDFEILIKNHMVSLNQCCSSKIRISTFNDGISLVEKTME